MPEIATDPMANDIGVGPDTPMSFDMGVGTDAPPSPPRANTRTTGVGTYAALPARTMGTDTGVDQYKNTIDAYFNQYMPSLARAVIEPRGSGYGDSGRWKTPSRDTDLSNRVSTESFIKQHLHHNSMYHLSVIPLHNTFGNVTLNGVRQTYISNYNYFGRPTGLWYAKSNEWMYNIYNDSQNKFANFPTCCYVYKMEFTYDARVREISSVDELHEFHKKYATYWIDYSKDENVIDINASSADIYLSARKKKIIIDKLADAKKLYKKNKELNVRMLKQIDWNIVSKDYDAVYFHYNEPMKYHYSWFDGIHVSSGCVLDTSKVHVRFYAMRISKDEWVLQ